VVTDWSWFNGCLGIRRSLRVVQPGLLVDACGSVLDVVGFI